MKINDYVRIKKYGIRKIEMVIDEPDRKGIRFNDTDGWNKGVPEEEIIKSSPNIIDLIEVGDYVNGMQVTRICFGEDGEKILNLSNCILELINDDIKSILTKEQIESMEYKVKE